MLVVDSFKVLLEMVLEVLLIDVLRVILSKCERVPVVRVLVLKSRVSELGEKVANVVLASKVLPDIG